MGEAAFFHTPGTGHIDRAEIAMDRAEPWNAAESGRHNTLIRTSPRLKGARFNVRGRLRSWR